MVYEKMLKPLFFSLDPEYVHDLFTSIGEKLGQSRAGRSITSWAYDYHGDNASVTVDGIKYRTPIILSAGFDYNARLTTILPSLAFGGVEVGSITARPCAGNKAPRLTRLPRSRSIIVNKGLRNDGVDAIIDRLQKKERISDFVIGVSIARTNDCETTDVESGITDYLTSFQKLNESNVGDYYAINISCPNAFGGETFAEPARLQLLLSALATVRTTKPIYIKMPINLSWTELSALLRVIEPFKINGVIIGNLNKDYSSLKIREEAPAEYRGGLSGSPCFLPSNNLIRKTREKYGKRFTIIGTGGIFSPADAMVKLAAGADLVQLITGMIYRGPSLIKNIAHEYAQRKKLVAIK
ncbi:quinone-dependent dihydroorotate dehydrogenase [Candidatus Nomurabacteria bacterium]|nr:quinone-dependent dihydroorotate dehydrogenase [Candidatus Nomurabacteria bacterium]